MKRGDGRSARDRLAAIVRPVRAGSAVTPSPALPQLAFPLVGRTIELRPFTAGDAEAMLRVYGDPEVMRWVGHGAVTSLDGVRSMLHQYMSHQQLHGFAFWAVVDRDSGAVIGDGGLARTIGGEIEMGYTLARHAWGHGRGTEVAALVAHTALDTLGFPKVRALVEPENEGSQRVLLRLGFEPSGTTLAFGRPHLVFLRRAPGPAAPA